MGLFADTFNAIATAIKAKDGGGNMTPAQMAGRIATLPEWSWKKPDGWTDLKTVLKNNKIDGKYAIAFLFSNLFETTNISIGTSAFVKFSDGTTTTGLNIIKTWNDGVSPSQSDVYSRWAIAYYDTNTVNGILLGSNSNVVWMEGDGFISLYNPNVRLSVGLVRVSSFAEIVFENKAYAFQSMTLEEISANKIVVRGNCNRTFDSCFELKKIPSTFDFTLATNVEGFFANCRSLVNTPSSIIPSSSCTSMKHLFNGCVCIKKLPDTFVCYGDCSLLLYDCSAIEKFPTVFDLSHATDVREILPSRTFCPKPPDVLDFSSVSSSSNIGDYWFSRYNCSYRYLPTHITAYFNLVMNKVNLSTNGFVRDSLAEFSDGVIVGGLAYNINSVSSTTTISLPSNIKSLFDSAEQSEIAAMFTNKGWTLAW